MFVTLDEHIGAGIGLLVFGFVGMIACAWPHLKVKDWLPKRLRLILIITLIVLAASVGTGVYRRYYGEQATTGTSSDTSGPVQPLTPLESLTVSPIKLVFKGQAIGKTSSLQTVTVVNRGTAARIITGIDITGNFSQTNDCGSELMVGDSCNVEVKFTPTTLGLTHGSLEISCHDPLFSSTNLFATVDFSGSGETSPSHPKIKPESQAVPVPATQPEEAAPQVRQSFDPNTMPDFLRPKPLAPDWVPQPPSPVRAETSDDILEEIRAVLEKDRELDEMQGCPAGSSVELRMVGNDISYYLCTRPYFAAWRKVNLKDLDFGDLKVSQPFDNHKLAVVDIPCLHPGTVAGLCLTEEVGTFPSKECIKKKLKTDYYQSFWVTVHTDNVDSLVRLWKEFSARYK